MKRIHKKGRPASPKTLPLCLLLSLFTLHLSLFAKPAPVKVSGFGLFGNAELRYALRLLEFEDEVLDARKIDDGAFLLLTRLVQNGYLDAEISATLETVNGESVDAHWTSPFEAQLPDGLSATKLRYQIKEGTLYYYDDVTIDGLVSIPVDEALKYVIPDTALYSRKRDRSYSPSILSNHQKQLASALIAIGHIDAKVTATSVEIDPTNGAVDVALHVDEGPLYQVASAEAYYVDGETPELARTLPVDDTYFRTWIEKQVRTLQNESFHLGYPDAKVTSRIEKATPEGDTVSVKMRFEINRGPYKNLTGVEHNGATDTHLPLLVRKADLATDVPLDITQVETARRRLSELGIFQRIDLSYEEDGADGRKAIFDYTNGGRFEAQLLLGYGSYERIRGGFIAKRENLFGRAHSLSFTGILSTKSLNGRILYSVPEILGESIDGAFELNYLDRKELSFDRKEQGISLGLSKHFSDLKTDVGVNYAFDRKKSSEPLFDAERLLDETDIGSISLRATRSTLDNILYPKSGYEFGGSFRVADRLLGGQTQFTRTELNSAYHAKLGSRWIFHAAAKGGYFTSPGDNAIEIPNGERFLIGGENSLRGYTRGEASPIDENGKPIGAETYVLFNLELEYPIFDKLNIVLFSDSARVWESSEALSTYDDLTSVGLGLRYNTILGPVRLEYGHNLNPRPDDPDGTLHLTVGFPF